MEIFLKLQVMSYDTFADIFRNGGGHGSSFVSGYIVILVIEFYIVSEDNVIIHYGLIFILCHYASAFPCITLPIHWLLNC